MKRRIFSFFLILFVGLSSGGGCNMFGDLSQKNSDEAILEDVKKYIDRQQWSDAVAKWYLLSASAQAKRENKVVLASAYAGWGGLNTIDLFLDLGDMGTNSLFTTLMQAFTGSTEADFNFQVIAEGILQSISVDAANRTADENMFLLFIEFAKLGTLLAFTGDTDADGTVDAAYENCTALTATQGAHVATAVGNIMDIFAATGTSLGGAALSDIQNDFCTPFPAICAMKVVADVDAASNQVARTLVGESNLGIGLATPLNDPWCQVTNAPIDPVAAGLRCPNNTATGSPVCP